MFGNDREADRLLTVKRSPILDFGFLTVQNKFSFENNVWDVARSSAEQESAENAEVK
jgi:hypothetical protein